MLRSSTIPTGGISPNCPFETAAPNCAERMPIRTSDTGEKRAADMTDPSAGRRSFVGL
jgi:hypothetical protein